MTITFHKKHSTDSEEKETNEPERERGLTANAKRRLRRERINAAKNGIVIPYEPRFRLPVDPDAPKLTNTGKRMARKRKKYAAQLAELGLTVEEGGPTYLKTAKKRKKNAPAPELGAEVNDDDYKPSTTEDPAVDQPEETTDNTEKKKRKKLKKIKNAEESMTTADDSLEKKYNNVSAPQEDQPEETTDNTEKKKRKKLKKIKNAEESMTTADDSLEKKYNNVSAPQEDQPEETTDNTEKKKKKKKKLKKIKNADESMATADDSLEQEAKDVSPLQEDIKIKLEIESSNEEIATNEAQLPDAHDKTGMFFGEPSKKQRFILFVGNLSYEITEAEIKSHFARAGKIVSVRISKHVDQAMKGKCKGFAHLEVGDEESYLKALSMHHSLLTGRRINVEYSGGQTKDTRLVQKERSRDIKKAIASGDTLDLANPCKSNIKKKKKGKGQKKGNTNRVFL